MREPEDEDTRETVELTPAEVAAATGRTVAGAMCGGPCGEPLPDRYFAAVPTAIGPVNLCPACYADRFATSGKGHP